MRPIKFRVWDRLQSKMYYDAELTIKNSKIIAVAFQDGHAHLSASLDLLKMPDKTERFIPSQFTGLHDKNGKEIYEDDIVLTDERGWKAQVVYGNGYFMCEDLKGGFSAYCNWDKFIVIGNVHNNPKLLEAKP